MNVLDVCQQLTIKARATDFFTNSVGSGFSLPVLCFTGNSYPLLFFSRFFAQYFFDVQLITVNFNDQPLDQFFGELQISFLGQSTTYWCKDLAELDSAQRKKFLLFAQSYQGPHRLIFFIKESKELDGFNQQLSEQIVTIPEQLNSTDYQALYNYLYKQADGASDSSFTKALFSKNKTLSMDQACLFMQYQAAGGERNREVCTEWLHRIVAADKSLFTLSQYFFAQNKKSFMGLWHELCSDFPPEFWVSFWSEQLWQANIFIIAVAEHGMAAARKQVTRLPFSFMQKDYRLHTSRALILAHDFLYSVDFGLKNGRATFGLELFFLQFLQGQFARK